MVISWYLIVFTHIFLSCSLIWPMAGVAVPVAAPIHTSSLDIPSLENALLWLSTHFFRQRTPEELEQMRYQREREERAQAERTRFAHIMARRQLLCKCILENKFFQAAELINSGVMVMTEDLVRLAALKGALIVLQRMIDSGLSDELMLKAMMHAASAGHRECVESLYCNVRDYYAPEAKQYALRAVIMAVREGHIRLIKGLVKLFTDIRPGLSISRFADWGQETVPATLYSQMQASTPLQAAIEGNQIGMLIYLLRNGARMGLTAGESEIALAHRLQFSRIEEILTGLDRELRLIAAEQTSGQNTADVNEGNILESSVFTLMNQLELEVEGTNKIRAEVYSRLRAEIYRRLTACPALASPFVVDLHGDTILHRAAQKADTGLFNRIVTNNSQLIGLLNKAGQTPIESAVILYGRKLLQALSQEQV